MNWYRAIATQEIVVEIKVYAESEQRARELIDEGEWDNLNELHFGDFDIKEIKEDL